MGVSGIQKEHSFLEALTKPGQAPFFANFVGFFKISGSQSRFCEAFQDWRASGYRIEQRQPELHNTQGLLILQEPLMPCAVRDACADRDAHSVRRARAGTCAADGFTALSRVISTGLVKIF